MKTSTIPAAPAGTPTTYRTPRQNIRLHTLLCKLGIDQDTKEAFVRQYTDGRTARSSQMYPHQCAQLIAMLSAQLTEHDKDRNARRRRVISHLKEAGYTRPDGSADMPAIYAWVMRQKHKTPFNHLTAPQLSQLITAAQGVRDHYLTKVKQELT